MNDVSSQPTTRVIDDHDYLRSPPLIDPFGRTITYLRVSVTDRCDFRCVYCMSENMTFLPKADLLSLEELDRLCGAFIARGVRKLRLTGERSAARLNFCHSSSVTRKATAISDREQLQHIPYVGGPRRISKYRRLHIFRREPVTDRKAE